jgi:hypothetical protein
MAGEMEDRFIEWHTLEDVTVLTVRVDELRDVRPLTNFELPLSQDGRMSWDSFLEFKDEQMESIKKRKASLSASDTIWNGALAIQA